MITGKCSLANSDMYKEKKKTGEKANRNERQINLKINKKMELQPESRFIKTHTGYI
jgi:hypothetical protein